MPKRKVLQTVILTRKNDQGGNETVKPQIGSEFNFTQAELDQLNKLNPDALGKIITKDDAADAGEQTITLTAAELEQQKQEALSAQREQMEKDLRAQIQAENDGKGKPAGDSQNANAANEKGGKDTKAAKGKSDNSEDEI